MDSDKWPRKIPTLDVEGPNPRGRPRKKWFDNIREDFRHLNLHNVDSQDTSKWRAVIKPQHQSVGTSNPRKTGNDNGKLHPPGPDHVADGFISAGSKVVSGVEARVWPGREGTS
ncbi:hypothetical protein Bbelb_338030 [Branchiostoma belcheri]|nr:hypothetical protein Bbelb_338030 [Branchiostoma belcheri]